MILIFRKFVPIVFLFFAGCATLEPYVQDLNFISVTQERELSTQIETEIQKEMVVVTDPEVNRYVQSIGEGLTAQLPRRDFDYRFRVVEDKTPNAFTIPGGAIYVHTGLLQMTDRNELAGVLGHEIGHAYARHPAKLISREYGVEYLSQLIFGKQQGKMRNIMLSLAKGGILSRYNQQDEYRADEIGFALLRRAGLPTRGLLSFLGKIQRLGSGAPIPFLSSHPPTPARMARLEAMERGQLVPTI